MTFVYGNIVTQLMVHVFAMFFDISFKLLLIYIGHGRGKQSLIPAVQSFEYCSCIFLFMLVQSDDT